MSDSRCLRHHPRRALIASAMFLAASGWMHVTLADPVELKTPTLTPESAPTPDAPLSAAQLQMQVDELRLRVQGMEGKLKDSAAARKSADQARMEAERRLAEGTQEHEQLRQMLLDRETEIAQLGAELIAARQAHAELAEHLAAVQRQLPVADGGRLTIDEARQSAAAAFAALREVRQVVGDARDPASAHATTEAETALRHRQFSVARAMDAQGIYRVRTNDSLALIGSRFYGGSGSWRALFEANRHLLADPDQLVPGMTLVIP